MTRIKKRFSTLQSLGVPMVAALVAAIPVTALAQGQAPADVESQVRSGDHPTGIAIDQVSYALGHYDGQSILQRRDPNALVINVDNYLEGFAAGFRAQAGKLDPQVTREVLNKFNEFVQKLMDDMTNDMVKAAEDNAAEAKAFLAENGQREDVITTASGLQYKVLESGESGGVKPTINDEFIAHYEGSLLNGEVFDSSYKRGEPLGPWSVGRVVPGWQEVLQLMKPGDKFRVWIPPELGYGRRGSPPKILPNSLLIFDMELIDVKKGS